MSSSPECLSDDEILLYRQGETSEEQRVRIHGHLDACSACREIVHFVIQDDQLSSDRSLEVTTFVPGDVVKGRYTVERFVGRGGMGEVYRSFDRLLSKPVALKTVLCTSSDDPRAVRKLFDEVRNAQRVGHPHVCHIYELQEHEDPGRFSRPVPFFTMEFIDGERLACRMREGPLPSGEAQAIALQVLDGLNAAHAKGVLHLDFKGDNVLLRPGAPVDAVIMDFGLSRAFDTENSVRTSERLQAAGTLPYMALEQLECRAHVGPAADVYAFGVVLYEMLTGRLPFDGATPSAMLLKQLKERPIPPSSLRPGLSRSLDVFLAKCLSRDPSARYADAGAALAALQRVGPWEHAVPARPRRRRAALAALMVGTVCVVGVALLGSAARNQEQAAPVHAQHTNATAAVPEPVPPSDVTPTVSNASEPLPAPAEPPTLVPANTKSKAKRDTPRRQQPGASPVKPRIEPSPPEVAREASTTWTPRAVPKGGFWQPPASVEPSPGQTEGRVQH